MSASKTKNSQKLPSSGLFDNPVACLTSLAIGRKPVALVGIFAYTCKNTPVYGLLWQFAWYKNSLS
jgi:hypothetical protein